LFNQPTFPELTEVKLNPKRMGIAAAAFPG